MKLLNVKLSGTTDGSGDLTVNGEAAIYGVLYAVEIVASALDATADWTLTMQGTPSGNAYTLLTLTDVNTNAVYYPRKGVHGDTGAALTYDGTRLVTDLPLLAGKPRIVIAQGGATKAASIILYYKSAHGD